LIPPVVELWYSLGPWKKMHQNNDPSFRRETWRPIPLGFAGEKDRLLRRYWPIPDRQIETSVVLVDERWWALQGVADDGQPATGSQPA
jgi:hypothetical protein